VRKFKFCVIPLVKRYPGLLGTLMKQPSEQWFYTRFKLEF